MAAIIVFFSLCFAYYFCGVVSAIIAYRISNEYREMRDLHGPVLDFWFAVTWPFFWYCYFRGEI